MVKVALAALNSQYVHSSLAPWCLRAGILAYGRRDYAVTVLEGTVNEPLDKVAQRLITQAPDVLGLCCYIWNIQAVKALLPLIKAALTGCVIVLGGPEVSFCPQEALKAMPEADFLIAGEGELPFARLLDALGGLDKPEDVPGLCRLENGFVTLSQPFTHREMPPSPYCPAYFDQLSGRIAYIEASRGCPFDCAFCLSGRERARPRCATLERVFEEIGALARSGTRTIKFVDRTFNAIRGRADAILSHIAAQSKGFPPDLTFHFEIAGDILAASTMQILAQAPAGLFQFEIGLQSMDEGTLARVRRKTHMGKLKENVQALIAHGNAHVHLDLIAGLPGEDLARFAQGFDEAYALGAHALQLGFLKLIHGSAMREDPVAYPCAFDPQAPYTVISTPWMRAEDFDILRQVERALDKLHNSSRFSRTLKWLTHTQGVSPFALFLRLGRAITAEEANSTLSLDALTGLVADQLLSWLPGKTGAIKDLLLLDRLSSVPSSVLPACLKSADARFFACKRMLKARFPRRPGVIRSMGFLGSNGNNKVAFCDYDQKDPVTGRWPVRVIPLARLGL